MIQTATRLFPLWAVLFSALAYAAPSLFTPLKPSLFFLLGLVMFSMGISLKASNFLNIIKSPKPIVLSLLLQFLCMPFFAWAISSWLQLPLMLATGMMLVALAPAAQRPTLSLFSQK
jgi:BASS family bile acid:Na+ symporter